MRMARPSAASERRNLSHPDDPFGIDPVERLVHHHDGRVAEHRRRDAQPLAHAEGVAAGFAIGRAREADHVDDFVYAAGADALGPGHPEQVVASGTARLEGVGVEQGSDVGEGAVERPVGLPPDECRALVGRVEAEDHPHRGGLPGPVRADEAGHPSGLNGKGHPVQCDGLPVSLADIGSSRSWRRSWRRCTTPSVSAPCRPLTPH